MKSAVLFTVITPALALLPACTLAPWSSVQGGRGADREDSLTAPEGYRAELHPPRLGRWMASPKTARSSGSGLPRESA
jgi:hypothetical protein